MKSKTIKTCSAAAYIPIEKLKRHPDNPRRIQPGRLQEYKDSILSKGIVYKPLLVLAKNNRILAGNHLHLACQELISEGHTIVSPTGEENVLPVVLEEVDAAVAKAILFGDNNNYAEWVEDKLRDALQAAEQNGEDLKAFGFTQDFIDAMLTSAIKDAEDIVDDTKEELNDLIDSQSGSKNDEDDIDDDEYETLVLPKPAYEKLVKLLSRICKAKATTRQDGDSLEKGLTILWEYAEAMGL